jgi:hypothetical protein
MFKVKERSKDLSLEIDFLVKIKRQIEYLE